MECSYEPLLTFSCLLDHSTRPLFKRVLELTNQHTGYSLEPPGQEDFTIIQYNPSDQYTYVSRLTHCCTVFCCCVL